MAAGSLLLSADGKKFLSADGKAKLSSGGACCCGGGGDGYIQAKACDTGTDVDLWFVDNGDGTIVTTGGASTALPFYFYVGGAYYKVLSTNNTSATPGTMASGYIIVAGCPNATYTTNCTCCQSGTAPTQFTVIYEGIAIEGGCQVIGGISASVTNDPNGIFCHTQGGNPCLWSSAVPIVSFTEYADDACSVSPAVRGASSSLQAQCPTPSRWMLRYGSSSFAFFHGILSRTSGTACNTTLTFTNEITSRGPGQTLTGLGGTWTCIGSGGTATVIAGC